MEKINQVSIRLVNERPLLSEEQLTSPEKVGNGSWRLYKGFRQGSIVCNQF